MTTKQKRKAPAANRAAPKVATKQASGEPKRTVSEIDRLVTRWRFLEAGQDYQEVIAETDEESNALVWGEQAEIEIQLATLIPKTFQEVSHLLKFATDLGEEGHLTNGADLMMLRNVYEGLQSIWCN
jgi:hypothetical protein